MANCHRAICILANLTIAEYQKNLTNRILCDSCYEYGILSSFILLKFRPVHLIGCKLHNKIKQFLLNVLLQVAELIFKVPIKAIYALSSGHCPNPFR